MSGEEVLKVLLEGNERFRTGRSIHRTYDQPALEQIASVQKPIAAIVTCSDSRMAPEVIFDQPLGSLFTSRVPGNVASDSAKWMIDIAVGEFKVPLFIVLGHTGCLAVQQVVQGNTSGAGAPLRLKVVAGVMKAKSENPSDLLRSSVECNAKHTLDELSEESYDLRHALHQHAIMCVPMIYEMETGSALRLSWR